MTPPPSPAFQVEFLRVLQRILTDGSFVASYKFALLHALADLAVLKGDDSGDELPLSTFEIAEQFVQLYWSQAVPYPGSGVLQQNTGQQAAIVNRVLEARSVASGSYARLRRRTTAWVSAVKAVEKVVKVQPLWKLQTVGNERLNVLYDNLDRGSNIALKPGISYCFRAFHGMVAELARSGWIRYIRKTNAHALGDATDLSTFLFGAERGSLSAQASVLRDLQGNICFYCNRSMKKAGEVDHFIPWSRYPVDLGHNFVLAHGTCNGAKSDHLAAIQHLDRWCERNLHLGDALGRAFDDVGMLHNLDASRHVAAWAYSQAQTLGSAVWVHGKVLTTLPSDWREGLGL